MYIMYPYFYYQNAKMICRCCCSSIQIDRQLRITTNYDVLWFLWLHHLLSIATALILNFLVTINDYLWQWRLYIEPGTFTDSKVNGCFENIFQAEQLPGQKLTYQTDDYTIERGHFVPNRASQSLKWLIGERIDFFRSWYCSVLWWYMWQK